MARRAHGHAAAGGGGVSGGGGIVKTIAVTLEGEVVEQLSQWLEILHLTGHLTKVDPAYMLAGVIVKAIIHGDETISVSWGDLSEME